MTTITTNLNVTVKDGPKLPISPIEMEVEAYDKIDISLDSEKTSTSTKTVDIQPGTDAVSFFLITSSVYTPANAAADKQLTVTPEGKDPINLSAPQLYMGKDAIAKSLGDLQKITLENKLVAPAEDSSKSPPPVKADICIFVGRDATAPAS